MKTFKLSTLPILLSGTAMLFHVFASGQTVVPRNWTLPQARVNVKLLNEPGTAVSGATVRIVFCEPTNCTAIVYREGLTDASGQFSAQGYTDGVLGSRCQKEGYYLGWFSIPRFADAKENQWQPWDATYTSVLRKIENPIPMYAKRVFLHVPQVGKPCGYDLKECDWVEPWGKGLVPDFVFTMNCAYTNFNHQDVSMKLTFSNPLDGIQPANLPKEYAHSTFIWHRQAPEAGYVASYEMEFGIPNKGFRIPSAPKLRSIEDVEAQKFYFRVRTVVKDGQIVSALYGKLSQGFFIGAMSSTDVNVRTCYYLNPMPLDRNMEFDLKQNLFKNLKRDEQPRKP